jgi:pantetheine-phosphate adenylyltransferase
MNRALYAGSFDPFHKGHVNIVHRVHELFEAVDIVVAHNPNKKYLFTAEERVALIKKSFLNEPSGVSILPPGQLVTDYAKSHGIRNIVKGIRNFKDWDYEKMLHEVTLSQSEQIETIPLFSNRNDEKISSSAVKELIAYNADVTGYVNLTTKAAVERKQNGQVIIGLTGVIGAGKSYVAKLLRSDNTVSCSLWGGQRTCPIRSDEYHHIDLDVLISQITFSQNHEWANNDEVYQLRKMVEYIIKVPLFTGNGKDRVPNREAIGKVLFNNSDINKEVQQLYKPVLVRAIRKAIAGKQGVIIIDGAPLIDLDLTYLCNNHVIIVKADEATTMARLDERYYGDKLNIASRLKAQLPHDAKVNKLALQMNKDNYGNSSQ